MKNLLFAASILLILVLFPGTRSLAQGCVAVRHFSTCSGDMNHGLINLGQGEWQVGGNYRYFKSFRHFKGLEEQKERLELGTEVINWSHAFDLNVSFGVTDRLFANFTLPIVYNERSSLYEHGRNSRHTSYSGGLGDLRIGAGYWLLDPAKSMKGNISLGIGIKMPTGNFNAMSTFYNVGPDKTPEERPVDQSIQPGDGGWGLTFDVQVIRQLGSGFAVYGNGFYLVNPRETNGTRTYRETLNAILANEAITSVPDQFGARLGMAYATPVPNVGISLGARFEGVPVRDLIGGSEGFRRPGYILSVEPGINYMVGLTNFNLNVPVALLRKRTQSVTDRETEIKTGQPRNGDAAFADYLISAGVTCRFGGGKSMKGLEGIKKWEEVKQ